MRVRSRAAGRCGHRIGIRFSRTGRAFACETWARETVASKSGLNRRGDAALVDYRTGPSRSTCETSGVGSPKANPPLRASKLRAGA